MSLTWLVLLSVSPAVGAQTAAWRELLSRPEHRTRMLNDVGVPMRDGVRLSADVYLPVEPGRWPVILIRTPYNNTRHVAEAVHSASRGYAVVVVDNRGRYDSEGEW